MRFTTSAAVSFALTASLVQAAPTYLGRRGHPAAPAPVYQSGAPAVPPTPSQAPPAPPASPASGSPAGPPTNSSGGGLNLGQCNPPTNPGGIDAGQGAAGALYWMTNEPDGNFVMSASISNDGQLTFGDRFWTGGIGAHGVTDPVDSPDPLFSQSSVKAVGQSLVVVNAGSNTVTMFNIDPENPAKLAMAGGPVWSGGEFPCSATIDRATGNVCVLNGGAMNSVSCFSSDPASGLKMLPNSNRPLGLNVTTPPSGPADTASQVLFSADGSQLFASIKGNPDAPGFIAAWDVAQDGSLSADFQANVPADGGALPFSMTLIDGAANTAILNTDPALGFSVYDFSQGLVSTDVGVAIEGQAAACWSQFSRTTGNYYITDIGTSQLTEVEVNPDTLEARVVKQYAQPADSSTIDNEIVNIAGQDFIYIMSPGTMRIEVLRLAAPEDAQPVQSFDIAEAAGIAGITISTANLQGATGFSASA